MIRISSTTFFVTFLSVELVHAPRLHLFELQSLATCGFWLARSVADEGLEFWIELNDAFESVTGDGVILGLMHLGY